MVHALITAGKYGSVYESDTFYSGAVLPSISRPRSNFNCLVIRFLPDLHKYVSSFISSRITATFSYSVRSSDEGEGGRGSALLRNLKIERIVNRLS